MTQVPFAVAADLEHVTPKPVPVPVIVATGSWTGIYGGLNVGVGGAKTKVPVEFATAPTPDYVFGADLHTTSAGVLGGIQAGYNWQFSKQFVAGIEADLALSDIQGGPSVSGYSVINSTDYSTKLGVGSRLDSLNTIRGRVGYLWTDSVMSYVTAGWAQGTVSPEESFSLTAGSPIYDKTVRQHYHMSGWTVGFGTEFYVTKQLSLKGEYQYADLGSVNMITVDENAVVGSVKLKETVQTMRFGVNYHFSDGPGSSDTTNSAAHYNWTGFYAGINDGYGSANFDHTYAVDYGYFVNGLDGSLDGHIKTQGGGALFGAQAGYNFLLGKNVVAGLETDADWTNMTGDVSVDAKLTGPNGVLGYAEAKAGSELVAQGSVRARLGYLVTQPLLIYGTGGVAYALGWSHASAKFVSSPIDVNTSASASTYTGFYGWQAGLGAEYALTDRITTRLEYLHTDLGTASISTSDGNGYTASLKLHPTNDLLRVGFNYKFGATN